jgi:hypothetical protein
MVFEALFQLWLGLCFLLLLHRLYERFHILIDILFVLAYNLFLIGLALADNGVDAARLTLPACPALQLNEF